MRQAFLLNFEESLSCFVEGADHVSSATSFLLAIGKWTLDTHKTSEIQEYILAKHTQVFWGKWVTFMPFEDLLNIQSTELEGMPKSLTSVLASEFPNSLLIMVCWAHKIVEGSGYARPHAKWKNGDTFVHGEKWEEKHKWQFLPITNRL